MKDVLMQYLLDQEWLDEYLRSEFRDPAKAGMIYERYIGYRYETNGYLVEYNGIKEGRDDLGRDLVARKGNEVLIIQCKRWSRQKLIHEKDIYQLFGTSFHAQKGTLQNISPLLVTTGELSERAHSTAKQLGVEVKYIEFDKEYPLIKCNVNSHGKLYHLPFGKWYDSVQINPKDGDCYVRTVEEAVKKGFCSAYLCKRRSA